MLGIVFAEAVAEPTGFYAYRGVDRRVVGGIPVENFDGDDVFLHRGRGICQSGFD